MRPLAPSDREALALRWAKLRTASQKAEAASAAWNVVNDELMAKWKAEGLNDLAISQNKAINLRLNDAWGTYSFFKGEVERYSADLQAELAYRQLLAMGDEPPAAAWPAAADRDVPRPGRRPRPYQPAADADVVLGGLVEPGPVTDPALRDTNSPTGSASDTRREAHSADLGPVGGQWSTPPGVGVGQGAAGAGVPAAPITTEGGAR
ncbi:hypothetical protein OOJ91_13980 [Micromonospora lupini]|uniref:hypothetical protein n=1 Tax=Micromonospora lupini TaxID=285679 RepID=UPI0022507C10|nr:hypothetical protein [Micromonospora lupini]MCX5066957.1 hypothetical protein [Micromonospora lupini]